MRLAVAITLALSMTLSLAHARSYSVVDLGALAGGNDSSRAFDINKFGQIVGVGDTADGSRAFLWQNGRGIVDLGVLDGDNRSSTSTINDHGQVVGRSTATSTAAWHTRLFHWDIANEMTTLDEAFNSPSFEQPFAANNNGQVVGVTSIGAAQAFLWDVQNGLTLLENTVDEPFRIAIDLNDVGVVVGSSQRDGAEHTGRALLWSDGITTDLGTLSDGAVYAYALGINNHNQVVGHSWAPEGTRAFLWDVEHGMMNLGTTDVSDSYSLANDINDTGHVVGQSDRHAFVWTSEDGMTDLNTALNTSGQGWVLENAESINTHGQIVGSGKNPAGLSRGFLLNPIPDEGMTGDFDDDGDFDVADIDSLGSQIAAMTNNLPFDVTGDGIVDAADLQEWLFIAADATPQTTDLFALGDLNLDGGVDSVDLGKLLNHFGDSGDVAYSAGNLNSDKIVDSIDLGLLLNNFEEQATDFHYVPEPTTPVWLIFACALIVLDRRFSLSKSPVRIESRDTSLHSRTR